MYNRFQELCDEKGISGYRMCKDIGIQPSIMTDPRMGRRASVKVETVQKVTDYFGMTVSYLLGEGKEKTPARGGEHEFGLSSAFFRLKQGLEPYGISEDDADFLLDVYKIRIKKNNQG